METPNAKGEGSGGTVYFKLKNTLDDHIAAKLIADHNVAVPNQAVG